MARVLLLAVLWGVIHDIRRACYVYPDMFGRPRYRRPI